MLFVFSYRSLYRSFSISVILFGLIACAKQPDIKDIHLSGPTMGTRFNVKFPANESVDEDILNEQITERLYEINKLMSTYDPESELSRFNQHRFNEPFPVSEETALVVSEAIRLGHLSSGVLDVTVGPLVNLWGFGPTQRPEKQPTVEQINDIRQYVGLDKLSVSGNSLVKSHPLLYVDLSTIAKGYAVDEIAELLEAIGIEDYLVEIGGELRVRGRKSNGAQWSIAVEKPISTERSIQRLISIDNYALATSGDYRIYFEQDGVRYSHLIDPNTGKPIQHNTVSVTVVHPSSMIADGLATAFIVMGAEKAMELAEAEGIAALMITKEDGNYVEYETSTFDDIVTTH